MISEGLVIKGRSEGAKSNLECLTILGALRYAGRFFYDRKKKKRGEKRNKIIMAL